MVERHATTHLRGESAADAEASLTQCSCQQGMSIMPTKVPRHLRRCTSCTIEEEEEEIHYVRTASKGL